MSRGPDRTTDMLAEQLADMRAKLKAMGVDDAEIAFENNGTILGTGPQPVLKSVRLGTRVIENVAQADPSNIQQVAASQLEISNSYYGSVLSQARRSFAAAIVAGTVGLAFFLAAIAFILSRDAIDAAIITALSGAIVEAIAGLNFWLFGKTAKQLDAFHVRLEQTQRFLLANSVCHNLSEQARDAARSELVRMIATAPAASAQDANSAL